MRIIQGDEKYSGRGSLAEKEICVAGGKEIHDDCGDARLFSPDVYHAADILVDLAVRALEFRHGKCTGAACFESVKTILLYIREEADNATTGASVILIATTLYSSTNLFTICEKAGS